MRKMKLIEICDFQGGSQPPKEEWSFEEKEGYIRMLQIRDFTQSDRVIPEYIKISNNTKICEANDILIARYGASIGKILTGLAGAYNVALMRTIPDTRKIKKKYLYYYLKSPYFQNAILNVGSRAAQAGFNKEDLSKLDIECPKLSEQENIVSILDKVEIIIEKRREELAFLDDLIKARFVEMFGNITTGNYKYHTKKLGDVANVGSSHRVFTTEFVESGIPFYRGTEIGELASGIKPTEPYYISEEHYNRLANDDTKPQIGDLLMPSICNKGQVWMVDTDEPFYYKDGRVLCISPDREVFDTKYLEYFMRAKTLVEYPKIGSGSTFAEFKIFLLKDIDVLIPPRNTQEQFSNFVRATDKSKLMFQKLHQKLNILRQKAGNI